ncbi:MAG TPA: PqiC family protein [Solimonas sp.]|nr:PqiC family protein [Solimonas sp.]
MKLRMPSLLFLLSLAACAAAPVQLYTLASPATAVAPAAAPRWLDVMPVGVPAAVDVPQLVVRHGTGELALLERQQWAAPLSAEIRSALVAELARQAGVRDVHGLPAPADVPLSRLRLDVQAFETVPGRHVRWEAVWSLRGVGAPTPALTCVFSAEEPAAAGHAAAVEAHQRVLRRLAGQLASALKAPGACPATP